jgi:hypothetical protein
MITERPAVPPSLEAMLYAPANVDGSRKNCENCWKFVPDFKRCLDVDGSIEAKQVCGLHVNGKPQLVQIRRGPKMDPARAGLVEASEGSACDNCRHYMAAFQDSRDGYCMRANRDRGQMPKDEVHGRGCCAGWEVLT